VDTDLTDDSYLVMDGSAPCDPKPHRNLRVWQAGMELADRIYGVTHGFPAHERYGLAGQMQRAAVSIPSNIAEGAGRASVAEFLHYLHAARGSLAELDTQPEIAYRRHYLDAGAHAGLRDLLDEVARTLQGLIVHRRRAKV
jgi:four helix bundle protein